MSDADDLQITCRYLEDAGLGVERIPESQMGKRCDLMAYDNSDHYLVEVKSFHDDDAIGATLKSDEVYSKTKSHNHSNSVEGGVHYAIKQLRETPSTHADELRFVALIVRSKYDEEIIYRQVLGALYGSKSVLSPRRDGTYANQRCLYFSHSAFFRYPDLDAAIVINAQGATCFLNDYGNQIDRVRSCQLCRGFDQRAVLYDAAASEKKADCLVADCDIDRNNEAAVLEYVKRKYDLTFALSMDFQQHCALANVSDGGRIAK